MDGWDECGAVVGELVEANLPAPLATGSGSADGELNALLLELAGRQVSVLQCQPDEQALLRVHPIAGLIYDKTVRSIDDFIGNFFPPPSWQTVQ